MRTDRLDLMAHGRETFDFTVRHFPMTFPAGSVCSVIMMVFHKALHLRIYHLRNVAADAVVLNDLHRRLTGFDHFRLCPQRENRGVIKAIFGFEIVLVKDIVVGHMAVIATGHFPMGTARPSDILGRHDMAIDTGLGIIGKIGSGIAQLQHVKPQPKEGCYQDDGGGTPSFGRNQAITKKKPLELLESCHNLGGIAEKAIENYKALI